MKTKQKMEEQWNIKLNQLFPVGLRSTTPTTTMQTTTIRFGDDTFGLSIVIDVVT